MNGKPIHQLSEEEYGQITDLFEKRLALENLVKILEKDSDIYDRVVKDYGQTMNEFTQWWPAMGQKYGWEGTNWSLDFESKQIVCMD